MLKFKYLSLLMLVLLSAQCEQVCQAQLLHDAYAIAEAKADLPTDWEPLPESIYVSRNSSTVSDNRWMGRRVNPEEPPSPHNTILVYSSVRIMVCKSQEEARACLTFWTTGNQVPPLPGAYTSKTLGDVCFRSKNNPTGAALWFCRANVACDIDVTGPTGELNYPSVVEKIARGILKRAEASLALTEENHAELLMKAQSVGTLNPHGIPVVLLDEWAPEAGATCTMDWKAGTATIKRGQHILNLKVGSQDAQLDGKPITLAFPALRNGKDRLWCPKEILNKLIGS